MASPPIVSLSTAIPPAELAPPTLAGSPSSPPPVPSHLAAAPGAVGRFDPIPVTSGLHAIKSEGSQAPPQRDGAAPETALEPAADTPPDESDSDDSDDGTESGEDSPSADEAEPVALKEPPQLEVGATASDGEGSADDESDGEVSESDDDAEDEPTLKYSRLEGGTTEILAKDSASALAVSPKYIVRRGIQGGLELELTSSNYRLSAPTTVPSSSSTLKARSSSASGPTKP